MHIDLIALKVSKTISMIAKLRHFVPLSIIVKLYQSLIFPYLIYGISSWGQASQSTLDKLMLFSVNFNARQSIIGYTWYRYLWSID